VLREENGLDRCPTARAWLPLAFVDLERLCRLVGQLALDRFFVVVDRVAEHVQGRVQSGDLVPVEGDGETGGV